MTDFLSTIIESKLAYVTEQKKHISLYQLEEQIAKQTNDALFAKRPFAQAMRTRILQKQAAIIAECKKASPSKGVIRTDYNPSDIAYSYQTHGATCLSVLTDSPFFQGAPEHLLAVRHRVDLPLLRKDFIVDAYQIVESRALGADCILLILAALDDTQLRDLYQTAHHYNLDVLIETHTIEEVERALIVNPTLLGVNNRNLHTFAVDLAITHQAQSIVSDDVCLITESGINTQQVVIEMMQNNVYGFLIGEHCMRHQVPGEALAQIFAF